MTILALWILAMSIDELTVCPKRNHMLRKRKEFLIKHNIGHDSSHTAHNYVGLLM